MGLTATDSGGGGDFKPAPEGTHVARCVRMIDLGTQPGSKQFPTPRPRVMLMWELPLETEEVDGKPMPMMVLKRYTMSTHEKSVLRHDLNSWRGRALTDEEAKAFDLRKVLGHPCMVTVTHSQDGKYANIQAVTACPKGMAVPPAVHPIVAYEIEEGESETFKGFGEKMQAIIRQAPEFPGNAKPEQAEDGYHDGAPFEDDDIPF